LENKVEEQSGDGKLKHCKIAVGRAERGRTGRHGEDAPPANVGIEGGAEGGTGGAGGEGVTDTCSGVNQDGNGTRK